MKAEPGGMEKGRRSIPNRRPCRRVFSGVRRGRDPHRRIQISIRDRFSAMRRCTVRIISGYPCVRCGGTLAADPETYGVRVVCLGGVVKVGV